MRAGGAEEGVLRVGRGPSSRRQAPDADTSSLGSPPGAARRASPMASPLFLVPPTYRFSPPLRTAGSADRTRAHAARPAARVHVAIGSRFPRQRTRDRRDRTHIYRDRPVVACRSGGAIDIRDAKNAPISVPRDRVCVHGHGHGHGPDARVRTCLASAHGTHAKTRAGAASDTRQRKVLRESVSSRRPSA